jgi:hypothetical protein
MKGDSMSVKLSKKLASEIIKELSTNGTGKQARRIVLEMPDGSDGGGWALYAAQSKIEEILRAGAIDASPREEKSDNGSGSRN